MLAPRRLAALTAAATLAFPAAALAQGAGQTQYSDPFQGQGGSGSSSGSGSGSNTSGTGSTSTGAGSAGTGSGSQLSTTPPGSSQAGATRTATGRLPNTGAEPGLLALLGAGFILTGAGLRVRVRRPLA
jgi:LPXTG-motif cell wall-anchored protein